MEWMPIETAKDLDIVLAWHPLWKHPMAGKVLGNGLVWLEGLGDYNARYWMPLPPPP